MLMMTMLTLQAMYHLLSFRDKEDDRKGDDDDDDDDSASYNLPFNMRMMSNMTLFVCLSKQHIIVGVS